MPTTLILGGSGKVARLLTQQLIAKGHTVHSVIRNPSHSASLTSLGAHPIVQSLETASVSDLSATIKSCGADAIIWSAGAGGGSPERTQAVDKEAAIKSMDAVAAAGVRRFVMVSAMDVRDRESKPVPEWYSEEDRAASESVWGAIGPYLAAKLAADRELRVGNGRRGLEYTIVRPGTLKDEEGTGRVEAGKVRLGRGICREDVAGVVVACLENRGTVGLAFDVVGGDVLVEEAVKGVAEGKVDTFEGYF